MRGLVLDAEHRAARITDDIPTPNPAEKEVLVQVHAVALNPVDSLYVAEPLGTTGRVLGSDFAGAIAEVGNAVRGFSKGDRVAGFVQGACSKNELPGAFAEYIVSAAIGLCALTAAQALFYRMGIPAPFERRTPYLFDGAMMFIYGASTSVGLYAAQLVQAANRVHSLKIKLAGAPSPKHFKYLRAAPYSYDLLLDYRDDWGSGVRSFATNGLDFSYDCISEGDTVSKVAKLTKSSGQMAIVRSRQGGAWNQDGDFPLEPSYGAVWEGLGRGVQYQNMELPANPEARAFPVAFFKWLSRTEILTPNPTRSMPGGLAGIRDDGLLLLGTGTMPNREVNRAEPWMMPISGEKLVYRIHGIVDV